MRKAVGRRLVNAIVSAVVEGELKESSTFVHTKSLECVSLMCRVAEYLHE